MQRTGLNNKVTIAVMWLQGSYYLVTGVWPLISIETFQATTGRKTDHLVTGREGDHWLVMTVAALITAMAIPLLCGAWRQRPSIELLILAIGAAFGLTVIDVLYVARGTIAPIYLVDAAAEVILIGLWGAAILLSQRKRNSVAPIRNADGDDAGP